MKKKTILGLVIIMSLFLITGCEGASKQTTEKAVKKDSKSKGEYVCIKKGIEETSSSSQTSWKEDITFTAKIDNDKKLTYYSSKYDYKYNSKKDCDYWCDIKVKWNDEFNEKNYKGGHRVTKCSCDKNELTEEYIYDDIPNLASILRSDIRQLNGDNSFDLKKWLEIRKKVNYKCN